MAKQRDILDLDATILALHKAANRRPDAQIIHSTGKSWRAAVLVEKTIVRSAVSHIERLREAMKGEQ